MTDNPTAQDPSGFEKISPTKIDIVPRDVGSQAGPVPLIEPARFGRMKMIMGLAFLAISGILVFFLLPEMVPRPQVQPDQQAAALEQTQSRTSDQTGEPPPWQAALLARQRKDAQQVLARLLDQQFALEERHVEMWGDEEFAAAKALALAGDERYRQRDFAAAAAAYQQGLDRLTVLLASVGQALAQQLSLGWDALAQQKALSAAQAFAVALNIEPGNSEALRGAARAATLDQVVSLYQQGQNQAASHQLDEARVLMQEALALDGEAVEVSAALRVVEARIATRDFAIAMSLGLTALAEARFSQAKEKFNLALQIQPGSAEARDGLAQVSQALALRKIAQHRAAAEQQVAREDWSQARQSYQVILGVDQSLMFAQQGQKMADTRVRLDGLLEDQLKHPQRLSAPEVYQEARSLLTIARKVARPGARLSGQITRLETLLRQSLEPVTVEIKSDNQTDITLLRGAHLGNFASWTLSLKPGTYVLIGKREGYRDVRRELTVVANRPIPALVIQCVEKI